MKRKLKLLSVNVEGQRHLPEIKRLIKTEQPDVILLMEFFPDTAQAMVGDQYPYRLFAPTYGVDQVEGVGNVGMIPSTIRVWGEALLSKKPLARQRRQYLSMENYGPDKLPLHGEDNHIPCLVSAEIGGVRIGVIHGTWTPQGSKTKRQMAHVRELIGLTKGEEIVVAGDFNIPRGSRAYRKLAKHWKDNIPQEVETTIDPDLHYANQKKRGKLKLVVDYIWSTPKYKVGEVRIVMGVSDHAALLGQVQNL